MTKISRKRYDKQLGRNLYILDVQSVGDIPNNIKLSSRYFICFLAWDARHTSSKTIKKLARSLLDRGCVYFCAWGPGCERVHDLFDKEDIYKCEKGKDVEEKVIMTTWHDKESLNTALWYVLNSTWPCKPFEKGCSSVLAISIGSSKWGGKIATVFKHPRKFSHDLLYGKHNAG